MADERVHARMQVVRELFGLEETADGVDGRSEPLADVRPLRRRRAAPGLMRIGTRGSALALAQAELVAELLGGASGSSSSRSRRAATAARWSATSRAG